MGTNAETVTSQLDEQPAAAGRFWRPRYWSTWLLITWLRAMAILPLHAAIGIQRLVARAIWPIAGRSRLTIEKNLEICFPELGAAQRDALARASFANVLVSLAEIGHAWFGNAERLRRRFRVEGLENVQAGLSQGRGVLLFSGHFTPLEICVPVLRTLVPYFAFMFGARGNALLDAYQSSRRERAAHTSVKNSDARALLRLLQRNATVWYAADQVPAGSKGVLMDFFGEPALTATSASRIAKLSGAAVVPFFFRRLPGDRGYLLRFEAPVRDLSGDDPVADTARLTKILEGFVRECPEQYFWTHRKFKNRSPELPDVYRRRRVAGPLQPSLGDSVWFTPLTILAIAAFVVLFDNQSFWKIALRATIVDDHRGAILLSMFLIMLCTLTIAVAFAAGRAMLRIVAVTMLCCAAVTGYFMSEYGIVIDESMIRNVVETQVQEAAPLVSGSLLVHLILFGVVPSLAVVLLPIRVRGWQRELSARAALVAVSAVLMVGTVYANYGPVSYFAQDNHSARMFINPGYPIYAALRFMFRDDARPPTVRQPIEARIAASHVERAKPRLFVLVMGETARADRFSLNGYARTTNAYTKSFDVINFPDVTSCGTSTADSVPCVFSSLTRDNFSHAAAAANESLFGMLSRLGIAVHWRDNSTGCKNVCADSQFEEFATDDDPEYCDPHGCFDEILLNGLDSLVTDTSRDHFVVLHQRGSHGPAYHTNVPAERKAFLPECAKANLRNCDLDALNNAYDNTILYTDFFLKRVIEYLEAKEGAYDTAMLYVSDHGESLGENGLYLHGFPNAIAPIEQIKVPMMFWGAASFYAAARLDPGCLRGAAVKPWTHAAIFHTLLPIFDIESSEYRSELDMFATCRLRAMGGHFTAN